MKKSIIFGFLFVIFLSSSAFALHKFYVSIYQINHNPEKKMLQITARIFIDDLNESIGFEYKTKTYFGEKTVSQNDELLLKKYIDQHLIIQINGQTKQINYLSNEIEGNVLICYFNAKNVSKIKSLKIKNTALMALNSDQQNIIQTTINGKKQSLLLSNDVSFGVIN